ncbi:MAG TPA: hypothetical protein VNZ49_15105 [Bacteroidia bacterium]|jgi:hypothetical protein|nr:hypothetical protein [Bacteroidia bacterium]
MEGKTGLTESLLEKVEDYGATSLELLKLKAIDKTAGAVSSAISYLLIILMLIAGIFVASIGAAIWLGDLLGKIYYGFFWVAGFYGFLGVVLYLAGKNRLRKYIGDSFITQVLN